MAFFGFLTILGGYGLLTIFCARRFVASLKAGQQCRLQHAEDTLKILETRKIDGIREKVILQQEALEIFTLYDITKEITKCLNENEAFEVFKKKLHEHVPFRKCFLFDPKSNDFNMLELHPDCFVFPLRSKEGMIGSLAVEGVQEEDQEKVQILGQQYALVLRRLRLYKEIELIAIHDGLTEVHTRRYVMERFQEEVHRSRVKKIKMSYLMIDVDHFKKINDQYGHITGDQVLREIAALIKANIREIDVAGRYGGEEFCVILPDTDREGARYAAERIRQAVEQTNIQAYDTMLHATVSIGSSTYPEDGKDVAGLIDKADKALYCAKKQGRNLVCFYEVDGQKE